MRRALFAVLLAAGCNPDYGGTSFKCDSAHPSCPDGQTCVNGTCRSDDGTSMDGGTHDTGGPRASVTCGTAGVCGEDETCCFHDSSDARCAPPTAPCAADEIKATCDDGADCDDGTYCCELANFATCGGSVACTAIYCAASTDCPTNKPFCCPDASVPFKTCNATNVCP